MENIQTTLFTAIEIARNEELKRLETEYFSKHSKTLNFIFMLL